MRFDFNEREKKVISDFSKILDDIPDVVDKNNYFYPLNMLIKGPYFDLLDFEDINPGPLLFKMRTMLCKKNFFLYLLLEIGYRLIKEIINGCDIKIYDDYIEKLIFRNNKIISLAYVENNMNFNISDLNTKAYIKDNYFIVSGTKRCVPFVDVADFIMVLGKVEENLYFFILDKDEVNVIKDNSPYHLKNLGLFEIEILEEKISIDRTIGPFDGNYILNKLFLSLNEILISGAVGLMERSFEETKEFAKSHKNRGKPIIAYQEVGFKLAEMRTLLDASYLIGAKVMSCKKGSRDSYESNLIAKVFCLESMEYISSSALSILSSYGLSEKYMSKDIWMLSKLFQISGTSTEVSRVSLGDVVLGYQKIFN